MATIETLEQRVLLAADPGDTLATARNLKSLNGSATISDWVAPKDKNDYVRFSLSDRAFFNLKVDHVQTQVRMQLLSASGGKLESRLVKPGKSGTFVRSLDAGTYYAKVQGLKKKTGYRMRIIGQVHYGTLEDGPQRYRLGLEWADGSTSRVVSAKRPVWVIIHGWNSSPDGQAISHLKSAIEADSTKDQVLMLDWTEAVATKELVDAVVRAPDAAMFIADTLEAWGLKGLNVSVAGHSLGGYAADWIGREFTGGVDRIIALDPATPDRPGQYISGVDFARRSQFSLALHASSYGSPDAAATADIALRTNVGMYNSIVTHSDVVDLYANMIEAANSKKGDAISKLLGLSRLDADAPNPFRPNAYTGGFEGTLTGQKLKGQWYADTLDYKDRKTKKTVHMNV